MRTKSTYTISTISSDYYELYSRLSTRNKYKLKDFFAEDGLIDGCRFILVFDKRHLWNGYESVPVRSMTEAIRFLKEAN